MKSTFRASMLAGLLVASSMFAPAQAQDAKSDSHLQAAIEVVELTGSLPPFQDQLNLIVKNSKIWLTRENPGLSKEIGAAVDEVAKNYADKSGDMTANVAIVWASYFKEDELKEIIKFFKTETGQKMANYQARIIGESIGGIRDYSQRLTAQIVTDAKAALNKQGHKFP